jgi:diaminopimelate epimerase
MTIPFTKAHGAKNDFLLTWSKDAQAEDLRAVAIAICDRHTGIGADGWILVTPPTEESTASIRLFNSDGSEAELSGNGTRCAAALLIDAGFSVETIKIRTGAGPKELRTIESGGTRYLFEMNMGTALVRDENVRFVLPLRSGSVDVTILDVGNPQCAVFVGDFDLNWRDLGREIESHANFPHKTNVSFVRAVDEHTIDVRFYERGAGETMSSGTGSTGAAAAAIIRGLASSPVTVITPAGPLDIRRDGTSFFLTGPAEIIAKGEFYL